MVYFTYTPPGRCISKILEPVVSELVVFVLLYFVLVEFM